MLQIVSDKPKAQVAKITPDIARMILGQCNTRNRGCEERRITMYAQEILAGRWMFTGEAIKISTEGLLLDGQHRLWAIVEANRSLPILVITGLDPRAQEVMDQGIPRRLHDALALRGEPDPNNLAAALRVVAHYYRDGVPFQAGRNPGMSHGYALKLFDQGANREDLHDALKYVRNRHQRWNSLSTMTALHFLFSAADADQAAVFTDAVLTGNGGTPAATALHEMLVAEYEQASHEHPRAHIKTRTVYVVQAWNAAGGPVPEFHRDGFPGIRGLDEDETLKLAAAA